MHPFPLMQGVRTHKTGGCSIGSPPTSVSQDGLSPSESLPLHWTQQDIGFQIPKRTSSGIPTPHLSSSLDCLQCRDQGILCRVTGHSRMGPFVPDSWVSRLMSSRVGEDII